MTSSKSTPSYTNHLIHESSPYLLQHAHNPVDWHPWNETTLQKAKDENKLLLISIGYAACHWCHVMEAESFSDPEVAEYMNENFVCIKVDCEERPDVDQIYMAAVQLLTGAGGWPLNCIALPDGRPFYGGTYFPKERWMLFMKEIVQFVRENPERTEEQADSLAAGIGADELFVLVEEDLDYSVRDLDLIFDNWKSRIDFEKGGSKGAPKFPLPASHQFLLHYYGVSGNADALEAVTVALDHMASGGIYDQVGGGFARYSTDPIWKVPHFEKMLYDNGQLVSLYAHAWQVTGKPTYERVVRETLEFIGREMTSEGGGFYSSLDADSEGEEGKFYVWTWEELHAALGDEAEMIADYYHATPTGNWEGSNILMRPDEPHTVAAKYDMPPEEMEKKIDEANQKLLEVRQKRVRPGLDDKILTSWNGLMLRGYVDAYRIFGEEAYLETALSNARFLHQNMMREDGGLNRSYKDGKSSVNGFLDDYAFLISAFINLYQATFQEEWLELARSLLDYAKDHFYDPVTTMFFYTSDLDPALVARQKEISDNVIPASNSEMAKNLFTLGHYFYNDDYISMARQMLDNVKESALTNGPYFANWGVLMAWMAHPPYEVVIVGEDCYDLRRELDQYYLPNVFLSGSKDAGSGNLELLKGKYAEGKTLIYPCRDKVCQKPLEAVEEVVEEIS